MAARLYSSYKIQIASRPPPGPDVNLIISKRQQHEAKAMRKQSERTHFEPKNGSNMRQKRDLNASETGPDRTQNHPDGCQPHPRRPKLTQVSARLTPRRPQDHFRTIRRGVPKLHFSLVKTAMSAKRAFLSFSRMKTL